jgi:hypothetical protein
LFVSGLGLDRPRLTAFLSTAPAPTLSALVEIIVTFVVQPAFAGLGPIELISRRELTLVFLVLAVSIGSVFGVVAVFGCQLGLFLQAAIRQHYTDSLDVARYQEDRIPLVSARIGAWATVASGILGATASILAAVLTGR